MITVNFPDLTKEEFSMILAAAQYMLDTYNQHKSDLGKLQEHRRSVLESGIAKLNAAGNPFMQEIDSKFPGPASRGVRV